MKLNPLRKMTRSVRARADAIRDVVLAWGEKLGARGVGYQMVTQRGWEKSESMFEFVVRELTRARMTGEIPWDRIHDPGSEVRGGDTKLVSYHPADEVKAYLRDFRGYRTSWWGTQPANCQTWLEKDGQIPAIQPVTDEFRVPLLSGGGQPSLTLQRIGFELLDPRKVNYVLELFDFDGSGNVMAADLRDKYTFWNEREHDGRLQIEYVRVALTVEQVRLWDLPTRPAKMGGTHAKSFASKIAVELDAAPPAQLRAALREAIEAIIEPVAWAAAQDRLDGFAQCSPQLCRWGCI
ncbi:MAG: hypothetical protein ACLQBX_10935 [Candidatus Limnocylindrales bacterium]